MLQCSILVGIEVLVPPNASDNDLVICGCIALLFPNGSWLTHNEFGV